jgi:hypothetical protein
MAGAQEYEVKRLLAKKRDHKGRSLYLVRWSGAYDDSKYDSWVGLEAHASLACSIGFVFT